MPLRSSLPAMRLKPYAFCVPRAAIVPIYAAQPRARCFAPPAAFATARAWQLPSHVPLDATIPIQAQTAVHRVDLAVLQLLAFLTANLLRDPALPAPIVPRLAKNPNPALLELTTTYSEQLPLHLVSLARWGIFVLSARRSRSPVPRAPFLTKQGSRRALHVQKTPSRRRLAQSFAILVAPG